MARSCTVLVDVGVGRAAVGRVVLEAAILWRVVRRRNHDAIRQAGAVQVLAGVVDEDGVRERGCRGIAVGAGRALFGATAGIDAGLDAVGGEHFERGAEGGFAEAVGVHGEEERTRVALAGAVLHNGLGNGEDVVLVKGGMERGPAVTAGAEADLLAGIAWIRVQRVIRGDQARQVDERVQAGQLAGLVGLCGIGAHADTPDGFELRPAVRCGGCDRKSPECIAHKRKCALSMQILAPRGKLSYNGTDTPMAPSAERLTRIVQGIAGRHCKLLCCF